MLPPILLAMLPKIITLLDADFNSLKDIFDGDGEALKNSAPPGHSFQVTPVANESSMIPKEHLTQGSVQEAIFTNIHRKRFFLAEAAPICSGGLWGQFGYNASTRTAKAILNGTYEFPPNFDQATKEILMECARIREMIPINSLNTLITKEEWSQQWRGRRKSTSSSESGLHFGHYIAGLCSDHKAFHPWVR